MPRGSLGPAPVVLLLAASATAMSGVACLGASGEAEGEGAASAGEVDEPQPAGRAAAVPAAARCRKDSTFPELLDVPEASGAAEITLDGRRMLIAVGDAHNGGQAVLVPLEGTGGPRRLRLPLDPRASDDLEGLAWLDGALYGITSAGAITKWVPQGDVLAREGAAYRIGDGPHSCTDLTAVNCGRDYEGLCLRRTGGAGGAGGPGGGGAGGAGAGGAGGPGAGGAGAACVGYAASKKESALYCIAWVDRRLAIDASRAPIRLDLPPNSVSDCAFSGRALLVGTNDRDGSRVYVVDEEDGALAQVPVVGHRSNEAIAVGAEGALYQLDDHGAHPSAASRWYCPGLL